MDAKTAQLIFGGIAHSKKSTSKDEPAFNIKSANDSLVKKNLLLKQQLAQCSKTIEKLRNENISLRQENQELIDGTLEQRIEHIVDKRVKTRLSYAAVLHRKLVQNIQHTGLELSKLFKELEPEPSSIITRRPPKLEVNLDRIDESPICQASIYNGRVENEVEAVLDASVSVPTCSTSQHLKQVTPRKNPNAGIGRRSELFHRLNADICATEEEPPVIVRRAPMLITPSTLRASSKRSTRKASTPQLKKSTTPAPAPMLEDSNILSTIQVRRQRSAKMNIKTLKEPNIKDKMRRPGKHDESMPYINTFV